MNAEAITRAIHSALEAGPDGTPNRLAATIALAACLREQPALAIFDNRLVPREMMARRYTLPELARWLILRAEATSAERAASDLLAHIAETTYLVRQVCLLKGRIVLEPVEFYPGLTLCPPEQLPPSRQKGIFTERSDDTSALVWTASVRREMEVEKHFTAQEVRFQDLDDARLILTLVGLQPSTALACWTVTDESVPFANWPITWRTSPNDPEVKTHSGISDHDVARARDLLALFFALTPKSRQHLRVPLSRLNRACIHLNHVDTAIDLGIALEALFLSDMQPDRGELTFRLRTRAARFLERTLEKRMEVDELLAEAYKLRSQAVHSGRVKERVGQVGTNDFLTNVRHKVATAIEMMLARGQCPPDWKAVELGP